MPLDSDAPRPDADPGASTGAASATPPTEPEPAAAPSAPAPVGPEIQDLPVAPVGIEPTGLGGAGARRSVNPLAIAVAVVAVMAGAALFLSGFTLGRQVATTPGTPAGEVDDFAAFWDAYRAVTERYAGGEVDRKALVEGAIKGMFEAIGDPYSSYLTSEEYRDSLRGIAGEFEGIGAEIGTQAADGTSSTCSTLGPDCRLVVTAPLEGSPAERAGLQPGDLVLAADGTSLDGLTIDEARDRIRGPKGTTVVLTIVRGAADPIEVSVVRDVIIQREVTERDLAGGEVGYLRLSGFSEHGAEQLRDAVEADIDAGRRKLILDLRGNPGGFVTAAQDVSSIFLDGGTVFWQEDADGSQVETTASTGGPATDPKIEVIVLIDQGSASASEIVAGALQDRGRATLVGQTTFGKGTVQQWTTLSDDHGGFRLTVAKWLTPNKTWVHGTGIAPDVEVTVPDGTPADDDPVLDRALELLDAGLTGAQLRVAA